MECNNQFFRKDIDNMIIRIKQKSKINENNK